MAALAELARILAVLASAGLGARGQVARTIEDRGGLYNMVFGYAMTTPDDYDSVITSSGCVCRSRCLALAGCRSVSLVPLDGDAGGRVECRTSDKPARLLELKERPRLAKTPGAVHFLETYEGRHNDLEIDGFRYIRSYKHECSKESNPVIDTWERFHIITSVFEEKKFGSLKVGLFHNASGPMAWHRFGQVFPFSNYELNMTVVDDRNGPNEWASFYMQKVDGKYLLIGDNQNLPDKSLCMHNPLNLKWEKGN